VCSRVLLGAVVAQSHVLHSSTFTYYKKTTKRFDIYRQQSPAECRIMRHTEVVTSTALTRYGPRGYLDDPDQLRLFAECIAAGLSAKEIVELLHISTKSVARYRKDQRVIAACMKIIEARVVRITRRIDTEIERRLDEEAADIDTDTLLRIRKEYLGGQLRLQTQGSDPGADVINDAISQIEESPFAAELQELLERQPVA
jgi:transcriptional regulator with XRE-family HTH domain